MMIELRTDSIVDSFENEMKSEESIYRRDSDEISKRLKVLSDTKEDRYNIMEAAKWLWKVFFDISLKDITSNLRGYHELSRYFDEYANYENVLFALDENHRDHVIHSIWVMLIGFYLRKNYKEFSGSMMGPGILYSAVKTQASQKNIKEVIRSTKEHEEALWSLIALSHDLGYPIEKTVKANKIMAEMIRNFGFLEQSDFKYNFTTVHQTSIDELLNTLSAQVIWVSDSGYNVITNSGYRLDFAKSFERLDHGIMSAYLLQMYLDRICEVMNRPIGLSPEYQENSIEKAMNVAIILIWLHAISAHTNDNIYWSVIPVFSSFLFLCDELDEFSRYTRSMKNKEWMRMGVRTEFEYRNNSFNVKYTFDNSDVANDIEDFFRMKISKIQHRYEVSEQGLREINISCKDVRKAEAVELVYKKTITECPKGIIGTPDGSFEDVESFLNGKVNILNQS